MTSVKRSLDRTAINTGWGMYHPEYFMKPPFGVPPRKSRGGGKPAKKKRSKKIKGCGYSTAALDGAGYSTAALDGAGYSTAALDGAGYSSAALDGGFDLSSFASALRNILPGAKKVGEMLGDTLKNVVTPENVQNMIKTYGPQAINMIKEKLQERQNAKMQPSYNQQFNPYLQYNPYTQYSYQRDPGYQQKQYEALQKQAWAQYQQQQQQQFKITPSQYAYSYNTSPASYLQPGYAYPGYQY